MRTRKWEWAPVCGAWYPASGALNSTGEVVACSGPTVHLLSLMWRWEEELVDFGLHTVKRSIQSGGNPRGTRTRGNPAGMAVGVGRVAWGPRIVAVSHQPQASSRILSDRLLTRGTFFRRGILRQQKGRKFRRSGSTYTHSKGGSHPEREKRLSACGARTIFARMRRVLLRGRGVRETLCGQSDTTRLHQPNVSRRGIE